MNLTDVYQRLQEKKKRRRELTTMCRDNLSSHTRHQEILDEIKTLRDEKKSIENELTDQKDQAELEALQADIKTDALMLADIALTMFADKQAVEIVDAFNTRWVPLFSVRFTKE